MWTLLFLFGLIVGSFLGVIALRYDPERPLISRSTTGGRSHCPECGTTLAWFELVPIVSFVVQRGRCRSCKKKIGLEHILVELLSGLIFVFVPARVLGTLLPLYGYAWLGSLLALAALWVFVFLVLLLMSSIDFRLKIIPDEVHVLLALLGAGIGYVSAPFFYDGGNSFLGPYAFLFGLQDSFLLNRAAGFFALTFLFASVFVLTRGRGMGMGDVKLAAALGLVFGWPDALVLALISFIVGALVSLYLMSVKRAGWKSAVPFGPFLALGAVLLFFFGEKIVGAYFGFLPFSLEFFE